VTDTARDTRNRRATRAPAPASEAEQARAERKRRARDESLDVRERVDRPYRTFEVRNPLHETHYRVLLPGGTPPLLLCPCADFGRRGLGTCKHVEAVRAYLASGVPPLPRRAPSATLDETGWRRIEAALAAIGPLPLTDLRPLVAVGRAAMSLGGAPGPKGPVRGGRNGSEPP